ncbi:MAG: hypothetical protein WBQ94_22865 [Terracidiphilus sp.]
MKTQMPWLKRAALRGGLVSLASIALTLHAGSQTLTTIDDPNAYTLGGLGTEPTGINLWGAVTGIMADQEGRLRGFVRSPRGEFVDFDAPAADPIVGFTWPVAINDFGIIAGWALDNHYVSHGFLRYPNGVEVTIDAPGAINGTKVQSINDFGVITGTWIDSEEVTHGFFQRLDGHFESFDAPSAGNIGVEGDGTYPLSINNFGVIAGFVTDSTGLNHGFMRSPGGHFDTFDVPGAIGNLLYNISISDRGVVAGTWVSEHSFECNCDIEAGYQRAPDGTFAVYQGAYGPLQNVQVYGVNNEGTTVGWYGDTNDYAHAFVRHADGNMVDIKFDSELESVSSAINARGVVTGFWVDSSEVSHGFLWSPR